MALKFQYNKTTIQQFRKQLAIREKALPILQNKETALRKEERELQRKTAALLARRKDIEHELIPFSSFWIEFPDMLRLEQPKMIQKKIVGIKTLEINEITFQVEHVEWHDLPAWLPASIDIMKEAITNDLQIEVTNEQLKLVDLARKKTTQKVNLYEKVQIPAYEEAILKIKRFLEDKQNIATAAQKIMKKKKERRMAA